MWHTSWSRRRIVEGVDTPHAARKAERAGAIGLPLPAEAAVGGCLLFRRKDKQTSARCGRGQLQFKWEDRSCTPLRALSSRWSARLREHRIVCGPLECSPFSARRLERSQRMQLRVEGVLQQAFTTSLILVFDNSTFLFHCTRTPLWKARFPNKLSGSRWS